MRALMQSAHAVLTAENDVASAKGGNSARVRLRALARALPAALLGVAALACLSSCNLDAYRADLRTFVTTGLSIVEFSSIDFLAGDQVLARLPSGRELEARLLLRNQQDLEIGYDLSWNLGEDCFTLLPPREPLSADPRLLRFAFALSPKAEHQTLSFKLCSCAITLNRDYEDEVFSIICDSPPDPAEGLIATEDAEARAFLAFVLPSGPIDDDLAAIELAWIRVLGGGRSSITYPAGELALPGDPDPIGDASPLNRYFRPAVDPGYSYEFSVILIDAAGQRSSLAQATSAPHLYTLRFDGNGSDGGAPPEPRELAAEDLSPIPSAGSLSRTGQAFLHWSGEPGGGSVYRPGDSFTMGARDTVLYAQWTQNGTVLSFDLGARGLEFELASTTLSRGETLVVNCGNAELAAGGSAWRWYVDGVLVEGRTESGFSWPTAGREPGQYLISCLVSYGGRSYSGSFRLTLSYGEEP